MRVNKNVFVHVENMPSADYGIDDYGCIAVFEVSNDKVFMLEDYVSKSSASIKEKANYLRNKYKDRLIDGQQ